jgi:hypothetical protein
MRRSPSLRTLAVAACAAAVFAAPSLRAAADSPNPGLKYYYPAPNAPVVDVAADVVVYGGTSGGVIAAVQAVRMGKSVALVVFGRHVGGMTAGGLTATDGVSAVVQGGLTREYFAKTGSGGFRPSAAELEFENLLTDPVPGATWDGLVPTYYEQRLDVVDLSGSRIVALRMENGSVFRGKMFIDCSYEGDLMARAGVGYTYGREASSSYGESLAGKRSAVTLPGVDAYVESGNATSGLIYNLIDEPQGTAGSGDDHVQAYNFRMYTVVNATASNYQPLWQPPAYNADQFEILYRYHRSGGTTDMAVGNDINNHEMFNRGCSTDHIGGNRWPDGAGGWVPWADADYATRELMYQSHVAWQLGMLHYLKTDARYRALATDLSLSATIRNNIAVLLDKVDRLGLPLGEYPETGGWPHELYVREARRMVSDLVITQAHYQRDVVVEDSVGLANYGADSHHVRRIPGSGGTVRVEGDTGGSTTTPWRIPYRALIPKRAECENLLVSWALSASHVAFCSTRMEPCLMVLSQSAATAAALAIDRNEAVQDLPYPVLRLHLLAGGQILEPYSAPQPGIIVDNADATGVVIAGNWTVSSATSGYYGGNYLTDGNATTSGSSVTFIPVLPAADTYEVFARWTSAANRAPSVLIDIQHAGGNTTINVNQQTNGGSWISLGNYAFAAGTDGRVVIRKDDAIGFVIADAVRFLPATPPSAPGPGVVVIAYDPVADEETGAPGRFQFIRDTDELAVPLTLQISPGGTATPGAHYTPLPSSITIPANAKAANLTVTPVVDATPQGARTVTVTILANASYSIGTPSSATVSLFDKRYDDWRFRNFSSTGEQSSPASEPGSDPDRDGLSNRLEFVFGSNPRAGGLAGSPSFRIESGQAIFEYWHRGEASALSSAAWYSETLAAGSWNPFPVAPQTVSYDPGSGDRLLRHLLPTENRARLFFQLSVP